MRLIRILELPRRASSNVLFVTFAGLMKSSGLGAAIELRWGHTGDQRQKWSSCLIWAYDSDRAQAGYFYHLYL
ncbi:hypothetical protein RGR602_PC00055 (plasmid) [Rhizobium gallicum bv. gallicum R602sp]|uniref:Uncharacterized protein n=1 Tax=Rhizobium gallicum bv. gallicum R602sp TaxID=1041138 RepID=A0A0B4XC61_9HYPH|nr:hypothetical protein RGR602_PC00055 [Rhizobium gallicum bv. gallicum R602sp]